MYVNLETLVEYTLEEFLSLHANVSFPVPIPREIVSDFGFAIVETDPTPVLTAGQTVSDGALRIEGTRAIRGWVVNDPTVDQVETLYKTRMSQLNSDYENAVAKLHDTYPASETETWTTQRDEAYLYRKWKDAGSEGEQPQTPFLTALSTARDASGIGEGYDDLVNKVISNDSLYSPAIAYATGIRHGAEYKLTVAYTGSDVEALAAVTWTFNKV